MKQTVLRTLEVNRTERVVVDRIKISSHDFSEKELERKIESEVQLGTMIEKILIQGEIATLNSRKKEFARV